MVKGFTGITDNYIGLAYRSTIKYRSDWPDPEEILHNNFNPNLNSFFATELDLNSLKCKMLRVLLAINYRHDTIREKKGGGFAEDEGDSQFVFSLYVGL